MEVSHLIITLIIYLLIIYLDTPDVFQVPTLDSLQPNLDEFMEHFESFTSKFNLHTSIL